MVDLLWHPSAPPRARLQFALRWLDGHALARAEGYLPREGVIVEVGCREGFLTRLLVDHSGRRQVVAVEPDAILAFLARRGLDPKRARIDHASLATWPIPRCDGILLAGTLGRLTGPEQHSLLTRCATALRPGGRLVMVEHATRPLWKWSLLRLGRTLARQPATERPLSHWLGLLERTGVRPQVVPLDSFSLTPRTLIIGYQGT